MQIRIGKVEKHIHEMLDEKGSLLFMLVDPLDYKDKDVAVKAGIDAVEGGADCVLIGGSIGAQGELMDYVASGIKDKIGGTPLIVFPGNITTVTKYADAVYFMSLLNARNPYWIIQAQMLSAQTIRYMGVEPLPVGYIVVSPGGTVGWVGDANLVPRERPSIAASLALAGEFLGNRFIITDAGSNPKLQGYGPVPPEIIKAVKSTISVPYIVAGGIRTPDDLGLALRSGADIVQVGSAFEEAEKAKTVAASFARVVKEEGKKKVK